MSSYHPRCELREVLKDGVTHAAWSAASGKTHRMMGTSTITHLPADSEASGTPKPNTDFGQIHDGDGDVVRLQVETATNTVSSLRVSSYTHSPDGSASTQVRTTIQNTYTIGAPINWMIEVIDTTCNIWIGGTITWAADGQSATWSGGTKAFSFTISGSNKFYFKAGDYIQFSTAVTNGGGSPDGGYKASSYGRTELKNLYVQHIPALS